MLFYTLIYYINYWIQKSSRNIKALLIIYIYIFFLERTLTPIPHTLHEKTIRVRGCSTDITPGYPHLTSNLQ